jgi:mono/diheme cytochrome c family protein
VKKLRQKLPAFLVTGFVIAGLILVVWRALEPSSREATVDIIVPELSATAAAGKIGFDTNCVQCHGENAAGTDKGPPLVHDIYNPGHHADRAFFLAARQGVGQHHWSFGNMPPQPEVTDEDVAAIVRYVRELQETNGIFYRRHTM